MKKSSQNKVLIEEKPPAYPGKSKGVGGLKLRLKPLKHKFIKDIGVLQDRIDSVELTNLSNVISLRFLQKKNL